MSYLPDFFLAEKMSGLSAYAIHLPNQRMTWSMQSEHDKKENRWFATVIAGMAFPSEVEQANGQIWSLGGFSTSR